MSRCEAILILMVMRPGSFSDRRQNQYVSPKLTTIIQPSAAPLKVTDGYTVK